MLTFSQDFAERENFVKLYYQLGDVDGVLGKFEDLLSNFQRDLRSISSEIRNLQTQTMSMNMKLRNRKVGSFVCWLISVLLTRFYRMWRIGWQSLLRIFPSHRTYESMFERLVGGVGGGERRRGNDSNIFNYSHISKDDVNEAYLKFLIFLDKKVSLSSSYKKNGAIAVVDTESHQQKLLAKVRECGERAEGGQREGRGRAEGGQREGRGRAEGGQRGEE